MTKTTNTRTKDIQSIADALDFAIKLALKQHKTSPLPKGDIDLENEILTIASEFIDRERLYLDDIKLYEGNTDDNLH